MNLGYKLILKIVLCAAIGVSNEIGNFECVRVVRNGNVLYKLNIF